MLFSNLVTEVEAALRACWVARSSGTSSTRVTEVDVALRTRRIVLVCLRPLRQQHVLDRFHPTLEESGL